MIRNLKALGLALVAVFAMSAVAASGASAQTFTSEGGNAPSVVAKQKGTHTFEIGGRTLTCAEAEFTGTATGSSVSSLTVAPSYNDCHAVVLGSTLDATVTINSCEYTFTLDAGGPPYTGEVHVECEGEDEIEIHIYTGKEVPHIAENELCTYNVPPQTIDGVEYTNTNTGSGSGTIDVDVPGLGVSYTRTKGGLLACGGASGTATYTGLTEAVGSFGGNPEGIHVG